MTRPFMDRIHAYAPGWNFPKLAPEYFTNHFGLVSDFLSECWTRLRASNRVGVMQGRVYLGGALERSRYRGGHEDREWIGEVAVPGPTDADPGRGSGMDRATGLESRRRVKEQQKRVFKAEFRNTHFSYTMGSDGRGTVRVDAGIAQRRGHRIRSAAAGQVVGGESGESRCGSRALSHRGHQCAGWWCEVPQPSYAASVSRKREGGRAELYVQSKNAGR